MGSWWFLLCFQPIRNHLLFALVLQKNCLPFSVNQNRVIFSCILLTKLTDYTPNPPHLDYRRVPLLVRKFKGNLLKQYREYWSKNLNKDKSL